MGVTLRATTLIVATTVVTLSSAANANHRYDAARGEHWYGGHIRWCSGPSAVWFALLLPLRPFSLLLQRWLSPLLQRPLSLLLQMSTPTARLGNGAARPNSV
jgi:hypothetical protein